MPSVNTCIKPGICGFTAELTVHEADGVITATVVSACPRTCSFIEKANGSDAYAIAFTKLDENPVVKWAGEAGLHACCPMPMALIKSVEVSAGLALPSDISVQISNQPAE